MELNAEPSSALRLDLSEKQMVLPDAVDTQVFPRITLADEPGVL